MHLELKLEAKTVHKRSYSVSKIQQEWFNIEVKHTVTNNTLERTIVAE